MGEMADMILQWDDVDVSRHGQFDDGGGNYERPITYKTCWHCKEKFLEWKIINGNWRLSKFWKLHECRLEEKT